MALRARKAGRPSKHHPPGQIPPHNLEAEESAQRACPLSRDGIATALEVLFEIVMLIVPLPRMRDSLIYPIPEKMIKSSITVL